MTAIAVDEGHARVRFDTFDLEAYDVFLRTKRLPEARVEYDWRTDGYAIRVPERFAPVLAGQVAHELLASEQDLAPHLFDYQRFITGQALAAKRYAIWADTGLGKTAMFLEWARHVAQSRDSGVLIVSPLSVIEQTLEEAHRFYGDDLPIRRLTSIEQLAGWCGRPGVAITNYEKFAKGKLLQLGLCAGVVLDESSILKSGGGTIKWNLIKSARGVENKLSCTATPAPNDTMEYASQAAFLEKLRSEGEILWTYFSRKKRGVWSVKRHAREAFYRFMASWSIYLRDPAHYGFDDILSELPPPRWHEHLIPMGEQQRAEMQQLLAASGRGLFDERQGVRERAKLSQCAKGFIYEDGGARHVESAKPAAVARIVDREVRLRGRPTIVWTVFDEESEILARQLTLPADRVGLLHGSHKPEERERTIAEFKSGKIDVLVTKAQLVGYGLNLQRCRAMVFSGFDDSFERMYQAVRRAYRFGQTETVHVHVPVIPELEGLMLDNLKRKQAQFEADVTDQEERYRAALAEVLP